MRCAVYVRVSTDMETQKTSIAHQRIFFEKYIKDRGWTLVKVYQDIESGTSIKKREGLQALIEDSKKDQFDSILTKSISRFARNTLEGLTIIRDFRARNIRFTTIEDGFDSKEYDEFMFTLLLSIAQKESEKMSERIKFGKLCRAKGGYYNGSNPPYGYKKIDKYKIISSEDISTYVVKKIFSMYLEGKGLYKMAKELNENGYPTPSQVAEKKNSSFIWHQSTIRKILSNRFYVGDMIQNKSSTVNAITGERKVNKEEIVCVKNTHEPIIDLITFEEVQRILSEKKKKRTGNQKHLFSNILVCGECGSKMHYKKEKEAYICGKLNKMGKNYCKGTYIKESVLKEVVCNELRKIIYEKICSNTIVKEVEEGMENYNGKEKIKKIEKLIIKLDQKKSRLLDMCIDDRVEEKLYLRKIQEINGQKRLLGETKEKISKELKENEGHYKEVIEEILKFETLDRMTLNKLVKKIEIFRNREGIITYIFGIE
ncbi:recombinase family protein [Marinisporobacter balticus]|uniref:DNA invertase Pin-like site-specific DNA recombinase n=1 Tax=Marinisporobacter balticus TaxID=2018667 RepID=A0A4R2KXQ7_9FIRM|nr:recombinase family protein [Marinisporobacter balticus]TCO78723.1 DNA invertase Pin-like site-specific DNA recombinase [Marinisporobacter balticus]